MPSVIWTPSALSDVQRLYRFLAPKDENAAHRAIRAIRNGVKILNHQPKAGRPVDDIEPEFREWLIDFGSSGYIVLYRFSDDIVTILAIRHQKEAGYL